VHAKNLVPRKSRVSPVCHAVCRHDVTPTGHATLHAAAPTADSLTPGKVFRQEKVMMLNDDDCMILKIDAQGGPPIRQPSCDIKVLCSWPNEHELQLMRR
jgi:hypothetical protein